MRLRGRRVPCNDCLRGAEPVHGGRDDPARVPGALAPELDEALDYLRDLGTMFG